MLKYIAPICAKAVRQLNSLYRMSFSFQNQEIYFSALIMSKFNNYSIACKNCTMTSFMQCTGNEMRIVNGDFASSNSDFLKEPDRNVWSMLLDRKIVLAVYWINWWIVLPNTLLITRLMKRIGLILDTWLFKVQVGINYSDTKMYCKLRWCPVLQTTLWSHDA